MAIDVLDVDALGDLFAKSYFNIGEIDGVGDMLEAWSIDPTAFGAVGRTYMGMAMKLYFQKEKTLEQTLFRACAEGRTL